jgi:hypothetical protein
MKRKFYFFFLLLAAMSMNAQQNFGVLDVNNIKCNVSSTGDLFNRFSNDELPGFEVPSGSGIRSIYAANLWIGGIDVSQQLRLAAEMYEQNGNDWFSGPLTNDGSASTTDEVMNQYNQVRVANAADVQQHLLYFDLVANGQSTEELFPNGYQIPEWMLEWPAHGDVAASQDYYLASFYDYNENGFYDPEAGDYPVFCGDKCVLFIINDNGGEHTESGSLPIGLQIIGMLYGFESDNVALQNTVFVNYKIVNQGTHTLANCAAGVWCDFDLGFGNDDFIATDVARGTVYAYNGDAYDEQGLPGIGYGFDLPVQGLTLLQGPMADADFIDNPITSDVSMALSSSGISYEALGIGYGDGVIDNEFFGMTSTRSYLSNSSLVFGNPVSPIHYYNYMGHLWMNGQLLTHGNMGLTPNSAVCRYVFEGDSDPLFWSTNGEEVTPWTEATAGNQPGDRRMVISAGNFTLEPNEMNELDFAFVFARESDDAQPVMETFGSYVDEVRTYFLEELSECSVTPLVLWALEMDPLLNFEVYPNPTNGMCHVVIPGVFQSCSVELTDASGRIVLSENMRSGSQQFDFSAEEAGLYFLRITSAAATSVKPLLIY